MTEVWPNQLPQSPLLNGYNRTPMSSQIEFDVDAGSPKIRNRATAMPDNVEESYVLSNSEKELLDTFWRDTTMRGVIPFLKQNPETKTTATYQFRGGSPIQAEKIADIWSVQIQLRLLN